MSESDALSERDRQVLDALDAEVNGSEQNGQSDDDDPTVTDQWIIDAISDLRKRVADLEQQQDGTTAPEPKTTLQKYAQMVEKGDAGPLSASDRRAATIYQHWDELRENVPAGYGVTTRRNSMKKNQPSQWRVDLQNILGEQLEWEQIYRAMTAVATLSGGEPEQDEYGRQHVTGGNFEFHERVTPDGQNTYKLLIEA